MRKIRERHCVRSRIGRFDDLDFRIGQAVQLVDKLVDLAIRRVNLALENGLLLRRLGVGALGVEARPE